MTQGISKKGDCYGEQTEQGSEEAGCCQNEDR